ncbi:MAG TPA: hypothetical protein VFB39_15020 [Solirubrobacteraceae bacterium]|nr:hypothetical protein [Solirubrobacteraceae bacterium]
MGWPRLLMLWIPNGWDGPFGPAGRGGVEIVYVDRAHGFGLFLIPNAPFPYGSRPECG